MIKLRWLEIRKFRNVKPTRLTFHEGFNVLLGKNATGKTSLLKLIEAILRDEKDEFPQESFDLSYEISAGETSVLVHCSSKNTDRKSARSSAKSRQDLSWNGELSGSFPSFYFSSERGSQTSFSAVEPESNSVVHSAMEKAQEQLDIGAKFEKEILSFFNASYHAARMDEGLELFYSIKNSSPSYSFIPPFVDFVFDSLFPEDVFEEKGAEWFASVHVGQTIDSGWGRGQFSKIASYLGLDSAQLLAVVKKKDFDEGDINLDLGDVQFVFRRKDGSEFSDEYLSFGQKRFLTFLYLLWCNPHVCIADELVNGLHHAWIRQAVEEIGARQAFLTSQNPILFDYIPLSSQQDAQRSFLQCTSEVDARGVEWLVWKNIEEADARRIFEAYDSGLETLGQILETRGLW